METDQEYRSRLAVHPDFPKDEPYTLGKLAVAEGLNLDMVGAQLNPTCPREGMAVGVDTGRTSSSHPNHTSGGRHDTEEDEPAPDTQPSFEGVYP
jgi:hypothetical protein